MAFGAVWVRSFANEPIVPYLTVITGIAFWLRIAKMIDFIPYVSEKLVCIGRNTYSVMMHHVAAFMLTKSIFYMCSCLTGWCAEFDRVRFFSDIEYFYLAGGTEVSKWIYLSAGIIVPVFIKKEMDKVKWFKCL